MATHSRFQLVFFFLFILFVLVLNALIFFPYASVLFLALVFAIVFDPLYEWIKRVFKNRETFSAFVAVLIVLLLILGPISFLGTILFQEASNLYISVLQSEKGGNVSDSFSSVTRFVENFFPGVDMSTFKIDLATYAERGLSWIVNHLSGFFSGILKILFGLLLFLLSLFYFFKDGKKFVASLVDLSPLNDDYDQKIVNKMVVAVNSVVRGHIIIGIIQGTLAGIGFAIFGVPSPVLFGAIAAVASLIPTIGTAIILVPTILFLFFTGHAGASLGLLIWGATVVGLVDNLLGPQLIKRGIKIHPLLILLSALGGISLFGPIGFLAGPVTLSLLFALLDIYPGIVKTES